MEMHVRQCKIWKILGYISNFVPDPQANFKSFQKVNNSLGQQSLLTDYKDG